MRNKPLIGAAFLSCMVSATLVPPAVAANTCLDVKAIKSMHVVDRTSMVVKATHDREFVVRFTSVCKVGDLYPRNHFVYDQWHLGNCLDAHDALPTSELGPCFVKSVTPVERRS